jgi:tetratricopeptide (TPR) repeat protein
MNALKTLTILGLVIGFAIYANHWYSERSIWTDAFNTAGRALQEGNLVKAEKFGIIAVKEAEKTPTPDARLALSLNSLAKIYQRESKFDKAESLCKRGLEIREKQLGPVHYDVALSLNTLGGIYQEQGKNAEAESLFKRALTIYEKSRRPNRQEIASSYNNLGILYHKSGDYGKAEYVLRKAVTIREQTPRANQAELATSLTNLAAVERDRKDPIGAKYLYRKALTIREKELGPDHPDVAQTLVALAGLYLAEGDYANAAPLYKRGFAINEIALGKNHPVTISCAQELALALRRINQTSAAIKLEPAADRPISVFISDLAKTGNVHWLLLIQRCADGIKEHKYQEAEKAAKMALEEARKPGAAPHSLFVSSGALAQVYLAQGNLSQAASMYEQALHSDQLAPPGTKLLMLNNLAMIHTKQHQYAKAEEAYEKAVAISETALHEDNPALASAMANLATLRCNRGQFSSVAPLFLRSLAIQERMLSPNDPNLLHNRKNYATFLQLMSHQREAAKPKIQMMTQTKIRKGPSTGLILNSHAPTAQVKTTRSSTGLIQMTAPAPLPVDTFKGVYR